MKLSNPVVAKKLYLTIVGDMPIIEIALAAQNDPIVRNRGIAHLARVDQKLAVIRDALAESGCVNFAD